MDEELAEYPETSNAGEEELRITKHKEPEENKTGIKKLKTEHDTLEERLTRILCCAVCLDLPRSTVYQCGNGHIMCSECCNYLLADAQLRLGSAVCPSCRTFISKDLCVRNFVVEKAVLQLPITCQNCRYKYPRYMRQLHEQELCVERQTRCYYYKIGCPWIGPFKKKFDHEKRCAQPEKECTQIRDVVPKVYLTNKTEEVH